MAVDFGSVQKYNSERGFGFVSRTFQISQCSTQGVFFHIKKVKREYPDLARELDNGFYPDVRIWYETENTARGEQVGKLWLDVKDIPNQQREQLVANIKGIWSNINISTPLWLDQVTLNLTGKDGRDELYQKREKSLLERREIEEKERRKREAERQAVLRTIQEAARLAEEERRRIEAERQAQIRATQEAAQIAVLEQQRKAQNENRTDHIQNVCQEYGIETLIHFTNIHNLVSILQRGLLGRNILERQLDKLSQQFNDPYRLDGYPEAICLSISFPTIKCSINTVNIIVKIG